MDLAGSISPSRRRPRRVESIPWRRNALVLGIALLVCAPLIGVIALALSADGSQWLHLANTVLPDYVSNSLLLAVGVGLLTALFGVSSAWLTTMCQFPGRAVLQWALLLPLAFPGYITAMVYSDMLGVAGPVQSELRELTGWSVGEYWFFPIHSLFGAVLVLSSVLYPYVYLTTRAAFLEQSVCVLEASRTLGLGPWKSFLRVALPLARPALVAGVALAVMETLADYGTVRFLGVQTFTTGIFRTWLGLGDVAAASQLACLLLLLVLAALVIEKRSRRQAKVFHSTNRYRSIHRTRLTGARQLLALLICLLPLCLGFVLPALHLGRRAFLHVQRDGLSGDFLSLAASSIGVAAITAVIALAVALLLAYSQRLGLNQSGRFAVRLSGFGYAIPGAVIAIGVMIPLGLIDNHLPLGNLLLSGSLFGLIFAYLVRFLPVSMNTVEAGLDKIRPSLDDSTRMLGIGPWQALRRVHWPMMRTTLLTASLLVFVDVLKELPASLVLRPFNFNTLAVRTFELASDERIGQASLNALLIVLAGLIPVILLSRMIARARPGHA
jgi:iron(III) transport system permease protein